MIEDKVFVAAEFAARDIIETPDFSVAKFSYIDKQGNKVYYDGCSYWVVNPNGMIKQTEKE